MDELPKAYNPAEHEGKIYQRWEASGYFDPEKMVEAGLTDKEADSYTIIMPPPNANGRLHAGHALFVTLEDIMIRYKRMSGYRALWVPGADHAGFETWIVYEKKLAKEGRSRFDMEPVALYKEILDFTLENKQHMENDLRRLGASTDWSREKFTLDPDVVDRVGKTFKKMYDDGLVYRGTRIVNWCPKHQTSLSDVETEFIEKTEPFYYFQYGPFVIGTSRPETKFGDKYVVMHPDDTRYSDYKHRQQIELEWINGPIVATVIKDPAVDMSFGTGVMTITPWHDAVDFEIAERHNLEKEQVIDFRGKLLPVAGDFAGQKITLAREAIVARLKEKGLLVRTDEKYLHSVKVCYKCETNIEPQVMDQWFVKMAPLAQLAIKAVEEKKLTFTPEYSEKIFMHWMHNTIDWNISRQIIWGIQIPAKICLTCNHGVPDLDGTVTACPKCGGNVRPETDTFDTWFSSGQWPLVVLGFPDGDDFTTYYPTAVMETGTDLIFKWVPRMVIFGLYLAGNVPFHEVYMHGLVNDAKGQKMSKSKGNVISPIEIVDKYGTDALRMALVVGNTPGTALALSEDKVRGYQHFSNKLWNIARFAKLNLTDFSAQNSVVWQPADAAYLADFASHIDEVTKDMDQHRYHLAAEKQYHYIWHTLADKIIEQSKDRLQSEDPATRGSAQAMLFAILTNSLRMLHPFMPFVTEKIWGDVLGENQLLMVEKWPTQEKIQTLL